MENVTKSWKSAIAAGGLALGLMTPVSVAVADSDSLVASRAKQAAVTIGAAWFMLATVARAADDPSDPRTKARAARLQYTAGGSTLTTARNVGVGTLRDKALPTTTGGDEKSGGAVTPNAPTAPSGLVTTSGSSSNTGPISEASARSAHNVAIADFPHSSENEPTVAANPRNPNNLVSGMHFYGDRGVRCAAHYSRDGGKTWNLKPIVMPQLTHRSSCSDSVLAYAPDGSRVYFLYMDIKFASFDIVVSYSDDDGKTWTGPITVLTAGSAADFDKPWINTHVAVGKGEGDDDGSRQKNSNWVYVTATRFENVAPYDCSIQFTRSSNKGATWSTSTTLDTSVAGCGNPVVVQGSRPAGGLNRDVLGTWYHSGADGFLEGTFNIRSRYSPDNGATFQAIVVSPETMFELPFWLGPFAQYHRWWGGMFPAIAISQSGSAHIAYSADPTANPFASSTDAEDGEIRYITSAGPPYASWSTPTTVNDDNSGRAQGWATVGAATQDGQPVVYVMWEDHRTAALDNESYDVFYSKKVGTGSWSANVKLTDAQSPSDFIFLGDYYHITVIKTGRDDPFVYGVWTDRRFEPTIFDYNDDIWGARISRTDDN